MSQTVITQAFEELKAQEAANGGVVTLDEFVFASVPNLNITDPIDRTEGLPPAAQIVHRQSVSKTGMVNSNAVVYSVVLGADLGDFEFNWVGLLNKASGVVAMIVHAPSQKKIKTDSGQQGNVLTRSFLMEYSGASTQTNITTPADTWQIDFTARLNGVDERIRKENKDTYGAASFLKDGFLVTGANDSYQVKKGAAYIEGLRAELLFDQAVAVAARPSKIWVDVCWHGTLTSVWATATKITVADTLADYLAGDEQHYVFAIAEIKADGSVVDLRQASPMVQIMGLVAEPSVIPYFDKDSKLKKSAISEYIRKILAISDANGVLEELGLEEEVGLRNDLQNPELGAKLIVSKQPFTGAAIRTQEEKNADIVSIKDWDKDAGIYGYLCRPAIVAADEWCYQNGKTLYFPDGQYCIDASYVKKARWMGAGAPKLAPFPQNDDDKIYLRPGYKHKLPGVSIFLMAGATLSSASTVRSDMFSSMTYVIKTQPQCPANMSGIAIVMDMDVYDAAGALTSPAADNRVECDVGLLIDNSAASDFHDLVVFGYWNKAGTLILSRMGAGDNPDYTKFIGGCTMGYFGLVLVGHDDEAGAGPGLSGTQCFGFQLFANDHHSRSPQTLRSGQINAFGHLLFIDGNTGAADADLNGHEFVAGGWRTYSNKPVILDNCSGLHITSVPFEFPALAGQPDSGNAKFYATEQTRNVHVISCRNAPYTLFDHADFGGVVSRLQWNDPTQGNTIFGDKGAYLYLSPRGAAGGPRVNFTRNPGSTVTGLSIVMDTNDGDKIKIKSGSAVVATVNGETLEISKAKTQMQAFNRVARTLNNDTLIVPTEVTYVQVGGEGGVADDLVTIQGAPIVGQMLILTQATSAAPITIKRTGNIRFYDNADKVLDNIFKQITLMWNGSFWIPFTF